MNFALLILLMVYTTDAMFLQAEMAVLGSTPLPGIILKAMFVLLILFGGIARLLSGRTQPLPKVIFRLWLLFTIYLMIETVILVLRFGYPTDYVIFGYNAYYFAILLLPFFFYFRNTLPERLIVKTLIFFFIPLTILGLVQHFSGKPLLPTESPNDYLVVFSWELLGNIRAFSLFSSPSTFGHFLALTGGLGVALYLSKSTNPKKALAIIALALLAGYSTFTRATEVEIVIALFTVWMLYRRRQDKLLTLLPLFYGFLAILVAFLAPLIGSIYSDDFLSTASLFERYVAWTFGGRLWLNNGLPTFLFGAGMVQNGRFQPGEGVLVDNSFLGIAVHIGAVGLILWLAITWVVWQYILSEMKESPSPVQAAAAGAYSVWLFTSMFGINIFYPLPFLLFLQSSLRVPVQGGAGEISSPPHLPRRRLSDLEEGPAPSPA